MNISLNLIIMVLVLLQGMSLYQLYYYRSRFKKKDLQLIQYYLDIKFLHNILADNFLISNDKDFCMNGIAFAKEYFNLDEIIMIDSIKELSALDGEKDSLKRSVIRYIAMHKEDFSDTLSESELLQLKTIIQNHDTNLYVSPFISDESSDGMIICVETSPSLLSEMEVATLTAFINLLKKRMLG